jgi:hypothetical protein
MAEHVCTPTTCDPDIAREFGTAHPDHGSLPLYQSADYCGHDEPPEPGLLDDSTGWDDWQEDHPSSSGFNGEPICLLTPAGEFCPACTVEAREDEDLPLDEYVPCRLAAEGSGSDGQ